MKKYLLVLLALLMVPPGVCASETNGTISTKNKHAWGSEIGWINFSTANGDIRVTDSKLTGYAWSRNYGWINLDPASAGVKNDDEGDLSGYAWNSQLGWLDFSNVEIDDDGEFSGTITVGDGSRYGKIGFSCSNCSVKTDWRPESVREEDAEEEEDKEEELSTGQTTSEEDPELPTDLPSQLFDINLEIEDSKIADIKKLVARMIFTSFGTEPTTARMSFSIINESGQKVYYSGEDENSITVETEAVFKKVFSDAPELPRGKYTLVATTLYNINVRDEFRADFEIVSPAKDILYAILSYWIYILIGLIIAVLIFLAKKKHINIEININLHNKKKKRGK